MIIIYDRYFNSNELFIIFVLAIGNLLVWKLPKKFPTKESLIYFMYLIFVGTIFDHTISIQPFDYYDVNDKSAYQLMDFLSYITYGPFGYFFIYCYDYFKIEKRYNTIYIFLWTIVALVTEYLAQVLGVFHYKNGYKIDYSFPIYLLVLTSCLYLHNYLVKEKG